MLPELCKRKHMRIPGNSQPRPEMEHGPQGGQTVRYINSPTELSRPGPQGGQTVRSIHSPTELSRPGPH